MTESTEHKNIVRLRNSQRKRRKKQMIQYGLGIAALAVVVAWIVLLMG